MSLYFRTLRQVKQWVFSHKVVQPHGSRSQDEQQASCIVTQAADVFVDGGQEILSPHEFC
jgi:hypothetical protein